MEWGVIHFSDNENNDRVTELYELKSLSLPRPVKELTRFEEELLSLVKNIKFKKVRNHLKD